MIDIENKIIEKVIEKIDFDLLTDKIAEKVADYIIKDKVINPDPVNPFISPINPSLIPDQILMYGCTPTPYQAISSDTNKSDSNSL